MRILESTLNNLAKTLFVIMLFLVFAQIILRYFFHYSLSWGEEFSRYLFIYIIFIGAAIGIRQNVHVAVDILSLVLKGKIKRVLTIFISSLTIFFFVFIVYHGYKLSMNVMDQRAPATGIPIGLIYMVIPIGGFLSVIFLIEKVYKNITERKDLI